MTTLEDYIKLADAATEGPWVVLRNDSEDEFIVKSLDTDGWHICNVAKLIEDDLTGDKHAAFIAASRTLGPQMARALIEAEEKIKAIKLQTEFFTQDGIGEDVAKHTLKQIDIIAEQSLATIERLRNGGV